MRRVLDHALLASLAAQPAARAAFPVLAGLHAPAAGGGGGCCPRAAAGPSGGSVRAAVAGLPPERLAAFKALAGATTLVVAVQVGGRSELLEL